MAEVTVKVAADAVQFENTIQGVERQLRDMTREFRGAEVGSQQFLKLQGDIQSTQKHLHGLRGGFGQLSGRGGGSIGMAALQMAQFADDAQYGIGGIVNNIPGLLMSLGIGTGLTGVISIATVAANQLWQMLGNVADESDKVKQAEEAAKAATDQFNESLRRQNETLQTNSRRMQERINLLQAQQRASMIGTSVTMGDVERTAKEADNAYEVEKAKQSVLAEQINQAEQLAAAREEELNRAQEALKADDELLKRREEITKQLEQERAIATGSAGGFGPLQAQAARRAAELSAQLAGMPPLSDLERSKLEDRTKGLPSEIERGQKEMAAMRDQLRTQQEVTRGTRLTGEASVIEERIKFIESQMKAQEATIRQDFAPEMQAGFGNYVESLVMEVKNNGAAQIKALEEQIKALQRVEQNTRNNSTTFQ